MNTPLETATSLRGETAVDSYAHLSWWDRIGCRIFGDQVSWVYCKGMCSMCCAVVCAGIVVAREGLGIGSIFYLLAFAFLFLVTAVLNGFRMLDLFDAEREAAEESARRERQSADMAWRWAKHLDGQVTAGGKPSGPATGERGNGHRGTAPVANNPHKGRIK